MNIVTGPAATARHRAAPADSSQSVASPPLDPATLPANADSAWNGNSATAPIVPTNAVILLDREGIVQAARNSDADKAVAD